MSQQTNYFRIGLFVLIGIALLAVAAVLFGGRALFREKGTLFETFFDESVQGLDIGGPVKVRGVTVGQIEKIEFAAMAYNSTSSYIRVVMREQIVMDTKQNPGAKSALEHLKKEIHEGLRLKQASAGITGGMYLEADFTRNPRDLVLDFEPQYAYWPSQPSLKTVLGASLENFLLKMENTPFDELVTDLNGLIVSLTQLTEEARPAVGGAQKILDQMRTTVEELSGVLANTMSQDVGPTLQTLRELLEDVKTYPAGAILGEPPPKSTVVQ